MVFVKVSETYDLSTKIGKMGIVGIHTPDSDLITRHYAGFIQNMKFAKFVKCDVAMACASMLPADPLQIGMEAGSIAPQDMFNPILYTAVSNDSMSNILGFIQGHDDSIKSLVKSSIVDIQDGAFKNSDNVAVDQFNMYYALLSDADGWRKAMPQAGLEMRGLVPVVFGVSANTGMLPALNSAQNSPAVPGVRMVCPLLRLWSLYVGLPCVCLTSRLTGSPLLRRRTCSSRMMFASSLNLGILRPLTSRSLFFLLRNRTSSTTG